MNQRIKLDKDNVKKIFMRETDKCLSMPALSNKAPELYKAVKSVNSKLADIACMQSALESFKNEGAFIESEALIRKDVYISPKNMEIFKYQINTEFEKIKEICDEKLSLIEFVCNSLNCGKGQISTTHPYSMRTYDPKEYLVRDIQVHLGNLITNLSLKDMSKGIVFPKYVFGNFILYAPASADFSKITYPEYISGDVEITPSGNVL